MGADSQAENPKCLKKFQPKSSRFKKKALWVSVVRGAGQSIAMEWDYIVPSSWVVVADERRHSTPFLIGHYHCSGWYVVVC